MEKIRMALCQNLPIRDVDKNVQRALELVRKAAGDGAQLIALPEMFYYPYEMSTLKTLAYMEHSLHEAFSKTALEQKIHLCTGSFISSGPEGKLYNSTFLYGPDGNLLLSYSKCHLFDVSFKGLTVRESDLFSPGEQIGCVKTGIGTIGFAICYDIRFPELFRKLALQGAEVIIVPAVFNHISGPAHWHLMMRARAVENQVFLAGISQGKNSESSYKAFGHSLIVSPWGDILGEAGEGEEIVFADLDPLLLKETRERLPLLKHRRPELY